MVTGGSEPVLVELSLQMNVISHWETNINNVVKSTEGTPALSYRLNQPARGGGGTGLGCYPKGDGEPMEGFQQGGFTTTLQPEGGGQHSSYLPLCF